MRRQTARQLRVTGYRTAALIHQLLTHALWDSFLVSLSAIHGRAVFEQLGAWTPAAWVAAIESVVGIVIEGVFVAILIQRLFR